MADNNPLYNVTLPKYQEPVIVPSGRDPSIFYFSRPWFKFLEDFFNNTVKAFDLAFLMAQVEALNNLVSTLLGQTRELEQTIFNLQNTADELEDLKRRLRDLETMASMRNANGYLDS